MRYLLFFCCLAIATPITAQFGVTVAVNQPVDPDHTARNLEIIGQRFNPGPEVALNYWFRLPKQRVEFLPTVHYGSKRWRTNNTTVGLNEFGGQLKINVYPFDFLGDCGCPTFGKQGPQLQKGFYVQVAGGYAISEAPLVFSDDDRYRGTIIYGGGLGIDIGISNLLTITPQLNFRRATEPFLELEFSTVDGEVFSTDQPGLVTYQLGLQATFRLDHEKY